LPVVAAQQIHTFVEVDSVSVGDSFSLSIVIEGNHSLLSYPSEEAFNEDLEMRNRQRFQQSATRDSIVYSLQYFGVDDIVIDPLRFELRVEGRDTTLQSSRIPIFFKTTLAEEDDQLRPLKPIFDFARSYWPFVLAAAFLLIIAYLLYRIVKSRTKKQIYVPKPFHKDPFVDPLSELEKSIRAIENGPKPMNEKEFEQFYIQLGDAIRLYLKRVYEFPALEMTSNEIIRELQEQRASGDLIKKVKKVLFDADMVKFAKFNPASDQVDEAISAAVNLLSTARIIDSERIKYLEFQHNEEQDRLQDQHKEKEQERKREFEQ